MTIITNDKKEAILPSAEKLNRTDGGLTKKHFYTLIGTTHTSPELVFRDLPKKVSVSRSQELQIWYGQDWIDVLESGNSGKTCVDVYAWYA